MKLGKLETILNSQCKSYVTGNDPDIRRIKEVYNNIGSVLSIAYHSKTDRLRRSLADKKDLIVTKAKSIHMPDYFSNFHITENVQNLRSAVRNILKNRQEGKKAIGLIGGDGSVRDLLNTLHYQGADLNDVMLCFKGKGTANVIPRELNIWKPIKDYFSTLANTHLSDLESVKIPTFRVTGIKSQGPNIISHGQMFGTGIIPNFLDEFYKDKYNLVRSCAKVLVKAIGSIALSPIYKTDLYRKFFDDTDYSINGKKYNMNAYMFFTIKNLVFFPIFRNVDYNNMAGESIGVSSGPFKTLLKHVPSMFMGRIYNPELNSIDRTIEMRFKEEQPYMVNGDDRQLDVINGGEQLLRAKELYIEVVHQIPFLTGNYIYNKRFKKDIYTET